MKKNNEDGVGLAMGAKMGRGTLMNALKGLPQLNQCLCGAYPPPCTLPHRRE